MHRKKRFPAIYILFFLIGIAAGAVLGHFVLPIPADFRWTAFFVITVLVSFALILVYGLVKKGRRY